MSVLGIVSGGLALELVAGTAIAASGGYPRKLIETDIADVVGVVIAGAADGAVDVIWIAEECPIRVGISDIDTAVLFDAELEVCE